MIYQNTQPKILKSHNLLGDAITSRQHSRLQDCLWSQLPSSSPTATTSNFVYLRICWPINLSKRAILHVASLNNVPYKTRWEHPSMCCIWSRTWIFEYSSKCHPWHSPCENWIIAGCKTHGLLKKKKKTKRNAIWHHKVLPCYSRPHIYHVKLCYALIVDPWTYLLPHQQPYVSPTHYVAIYMTIFLLLFKYVAWLVKKKSCD